VKIENQLITVKGIPILESNYVKKDGDLEAKTGFDSAILRRLIVCDFGKNAISIADRTGSVELLVKIKAVGTVELPAVPTTKLPKLFLERLEHLVDECVLLDKRDYASPSY
jgi:hypothetical protein